jgi:hypothetical protein
MLKKENPPRPCMRWLFFGLKYCFFKKKCYFCSKIYKMATLEITVSDDSKLDFIVSLLKEFRYIDIAKIQTNGNAIPTEIKKNTKKKTKVNWTDATLDTETERLVWESITRHEAGTPSNSPTIKEVFYDL